MSNAVHGLRSSSSGAILARVRRLGTLLFGSAGNIAITLACLVFLAWTLPALFRWAVTQAVWNGSGESCRAGDGWWCCRRLCAR